MGFLLNTPKCKNIECSIHTHSQAYTYNINTLFPLQVFVIFIRKLVVFAMNYQFNILNNLIKNSCCKRTYLIKYNTITYYNK